jgi:HAD superfamily phosphoserine phosphatase-like hydrolase
VIEQFVAQPWRLPRLLGVLLALLGYFLGLADRGTLKATVARAAFGGLTRDAIQQRSARYLEKVIPARLYPQALAAIASHRASGDRLILLSASPDLYVPALGRALGFDEVVCTRLRWDAERLDGHLQGANCRGAEKLRQLQRLRAAHPGLPVTAYGNSPADLAHLLTCEQAYYVNARGSLRTRLAGQGLHTVDWA